MFLMYKYCKYIRNKVNFTITGLRYCNEGINDNKEEIIKWLDLCKMTEFLT